MEKHLKDCTSNQTIHDTTCVEKIKEFMKEQRLQWYRHMERMNYERTLIKAKKL